MNRTRIALLGLLAVLVAVWVSSASLPSAPSEAPPGSGPKADAGQPPASLFDLEEAAGRLRSRREEAPAPRDSGRNPFEFVASAPSPAAPRPAIADLAPTAPATPPPPLLTLSGIAERTVEEGKVRTAVISGFGQLFFAKAGDKIATRYEVTAIGADAVELRDIYSGQTVRLTLKD
jgi:hypothetical protein